ncbi:hemicentin-1-like [Hyposmocoma kahamanoa]|uniref:hemicentin-1-like n=1 Tax=Hyposmocoma kahamanoa TaxID=1477025 RepID=UPI000E6D6AC5|nr:hemicentin-1-like [Hyposmocoma kahamanoa]
MVLWFKEADGEPLYSYDVRGRLATQPKLWSSPTGFGSRAYFRSAATPAVLLVDSVQSSDAGIYRCRVDFKNSPTRNMKLNFTVITPPDRPTILDAKTHDQTRLLEPYNEGDTIELICETHGGDPPPRLTWFLENTVIDDSFEQTPDGSTVNMLTFPNIGRQHLNSRLVCQASNTNLAPPLTKLLILDINLRPLTVQILNKNRQLSADRTYEVECQTTGSRPEALVTWWKGSRQIKRSSKVYSQTNSTTSVLTFVPVAEDHDVYLTCRAENPRVPLAVVEDRWLLNVHYLPIVTLKLGTTLNPGYIKEGDDVYFECNVRANPKIHRLTWYKGSQEIHHNASAGIILSDQSLVIQGVTRTSAGDYSCHAYNNEGSAPSNSVSLQIRFKHAPTTPGIPISGLMDANFHHAQDAIHVETEVTKFSILLSNNRTDLPICNSMDDTEIYGAQKEETVSLTCSVDSSPPPTSFTWTFNRSGEQSELKPDPSPRRETHRPPPATVDVEQRAVKFREDLTAVCERAMPRVRGTPGKKSVYWWTAEIGDLRTASTTTRRAYGRCRRRRHTQSEERRLHSALQGARQALKVAIGRAKDSAKEEFLATLDADPWGRPYKVVRNKLHGASPMESLELDLLNRVVEGLFPEPQPFTPPATSAQSISLVNRGVTARSADIAAARAPSAPPPRPEVVTTAHKVRESCI